VTAWLIPAVYYKSLVGLMLELSRFAAPCRWALLKSRAAGQIRQ